MGQERHGSPVEKEGGRPSPIHMQPSPVQAYHAEDLGPAVAMEDLVALLPDHHKPRSNRMIATALTMVPETDGLHILKIAPRATADHRRDQEMSRSNIVPGARHNLETSRQRQAGTEHLRCLHPLRNAGRLKEKEIEDMANHVVENALRVCVRPKRDTNSPHRSQAQRGRRRMVTRQLQA